jgi:hypothetical protein
MADETTYTWILAKMPANLLQFGGGMLLFTGIYIGYSSAIQRLELKQKCAIAWERFHYTLNGLSSDKEFANTSKMSKWSPIM